MEHPERKQNAINTFNALLAYGAVPVVNENDTVATEEIVYGDNDTLSAMVSTLVKADLLIILSDIDGLYDANPNTHPDAVLLHTVSEITEEVLQMASGSDSKVGTGGMITKLHAAEIATEAGIDMVITNSEVPNILQLILSGEEAGTWFKAN